MSYRKLDDNGDMVFGNGSLDFFINDVDEVAQSIQTRLKLYSGESFLNTSAWVPLPAIVGKDAQATIQPAMRQVIVETPTNPTINSLDYVYDPVDRKATLHIDISTIYGQSTITTEI